MERNNSSNGSTIIILLLLIMVFVAYKNGFFNQQKIVETVDTVMQVNPVVLSTPNYQVQDITSEMTGNYEQVTPVPDNLENKTNAIRVATELMQENFSAAFNDCNATRVASFPNNQDACDNVVKAYSTAQAQLYNLATGD